VICGHTFHGFRPEFLAFFRVRPRAIGREIQRVPRQIRIEYFGLIYHFLDRESDEGKVAPKTPARTLGLEGKKRRFRVCSGCLVCGMVWTMSANEVLEQVKALPPRERRKFFECVHELEATIDSQPVESSRGELARELMGAGRRWLKPGADPIGDLVKERQQDDKLDQADERQFLHPC